MKFFRFFTWGIFFALLSCDTQTSLETDNTPNSSEEGLFIINTEKEGTDFVENGNIVMRFPAKRIKITKAVLRVDTDTPKVYWVEISKNEMLDSGDYYIFHLNGKNYKGFKTRGHLWALRFEDVEGGRAFLSKLAKVYNLSETDVKDHTL